MTLLDKLAFGVHLYDYYTGPERLVDKVETFNWVIFQSFKHPRTGGFERPSFSLSELKSRFELITLEAVAFRAKPVIVSPVAKTPHPHRSYPFKRLFVTETSLINPQSYLSVQ